VRLRPRRTDHGGDRPHKAGVCEGRSEGGMIRQGLCQAGRIFFRTSSL
jgi:hypothetical protein